MIYKVYIKTYGCQMNAYDSQRIGDLLTSTPDFVLVQEPDEADIIILNTCSIREKAQEKVFSDLGRYALLKKQKSHMIIAVGGCVASQEGKAILARAPYVDIIFGPHTFHRLLEMIQTTRQDSHPVIDIVEASIEKFDCLPAVKAQGSVASITIMEGCNHFCSYCIVPYTRGREISRPMEDILRDTQILVDQGVKEITLLGQNVNNYQDPRSHQILSDLIRRIAELPAIKRIRFTTSHPMAFSDDLIETYRDVPKLVNHLHLPVQSGSNRILKAMNRQYTIEEYQDKIHRLKLIRPTLHLSSDFIVGFPSESEDDFEATLTLANTLQFDHSFSFIYSPRPGTPASKLPDVIPLTVKKQRLARLQSVLLKSEQAMSQQMVNTIQEILVTDHSKKNPTELMGRTENNRIVNFKGPQTLLGTFVNVQITEALPNSLRGEYRLSFRPRLRGGKLQRESS